MVYLAAAPERPVRSSPIPGHGVPVDFLEPDAELVAKQSFPPPGKRSHLRLQIFGLHFHAKQPAPPKEDIRGFIERVAKKRLGPVNDSGYFPFESQDIVRSEVAVDQFALFGAGRGQFADSRQQALNRVHRYITGREAPVVAATVGDRGQKAAPA